MTDAQASEAARQLARARWGDTGLRSAVQTISDRRGELTPALKAELLQIAGDPRDGDDAP
jgi:hypothetical protein